MSGYVLKAAGRPAHVTLDWRRGFIGPEETVEADLGWTIDSKESGPETLAVSECGRDEGRTRAVFRGGVAGRFYMVSNRVRTSAGRVLERAFVLRIAVGPRPR